MGHVLKPYILIHTYCILTLQSHIFAFQSFNVYSLPLRQDEPFGVYVKMLLPPIVHHQMLSPFLRYRSMGCITNVTGLLYEDHTRPENDQQPAGLRRGSEWNNYTYVQRR